MSNGGVGGPITVYSPGVGWESGQDFSPGALVQHNGSLYIVTNYISNSTVAPGLDTDNFNALSAYSLPVAGGVPIAVTQPVAFTPPPPLSEWTWLNQGPYDDPTNYPVLVTADDIPGGIRFTVPGPTNDPAIILANAALPDPPYTITMAFRCGLLPNMAQITLAIRNSDTNKTIFTGIEGTSNPSWLGYIYGVPSVTSTTFEGPNSFSKSAANLPPINGVFWLRIQNDGSEMHNFVSPDGLAFVEVLGIDSSTFGAMDQYGLEFFNSNAHQDDSPFIEAYESKDDGEFEGRVVVDLLSFELVEELVITTPYIII